MDWEFILAAFVLGTVFGSFLNAVAFRYGSGLSALRGRSECFSCGTALSWRELVPVASFVRQRGRCRTCGSRISFQYPAVEFATGLAFAGAYAKTVGAYGLAPGSAIDFALSSSAWCLFMVILVYDVRHKIIPDKFVYALIALGALGIAATGDWGGLFALPDVVAVTLAGPLLFAPFFVLWLVSQGRWIGLGDAKLAWAIGWLLGLSRGISAILIGFWAGALWSILIILASKLPKDFGRRLSLPRHVTGKTEIPFAPFLILGYALVYFFELSAISF